jgi:phage N-6-adenine-methyltransferase
MRCEEFYEKWKKAGNFCEKHPKTASRIEKFLDLIVVELDEELAKSEIFQGGNGPNGPVISEGASRPLISETDPDVRYEAIHQIVKVAEEKHMDGLPVKVIGREVEEILETVKAKKNGAHVANNSGDNEWYTPQRIVDRVHQVMGGIDLDPASHEDANAIIRAGAFFTEKDNSLGRDWNGRVFMNPPYAQPLISEFCAKITREVLSGNISEAIVLVNNATETQWFQDMAAEASAICFPRGRVKFWHPRKVSSVPLQGQAIIYFGSNVSGFVDAFSGEGMVWLNGAKSEIKN